MIAHIHRRDLRLPMHAANLSLNVVLGSFFEKTIMHTLVVHDRFRAHVPSSLLRTQIRPSTSLDFQKRGGAAGGAPYFGARLPSTLFRQSYTTALPECLGVGLILLKLIEFWP